MMEYIRHVAEFVPPSLAMGLLVGYVIGKIRGRKLQRLVDQERSVRCKTGYWTIDPLLGDVSFRYLGKDSIISDYLKINPENRTKP